jgi:hypothetical protein
MQLDQDGKYFSIARQELSSAWIEYVERKIHTVFGHGCLFFMVTIVQT